LLVYYGTYVATTNTSYLNVGRVAFHATPPVPTCSVPDVRGKSLPVAKRLIVAAHCSVGAIRYVYSTRNAAGWVLSQQPAGLAAAPTYAKGTRVALVVSRGPHPK
jgi:beta-lactam-binding protein with PASTA domain